jgi:uncharacterized protein YeaO (DUF488 family)
MAIRVVRLGTPRAENEGLRIGTVRRPPRGVKKEEFASRDWFDVWLPDVAPSAELMKLGRDVQTEKAWTAFAGKYRRELAAPEKQRTLALLAAFSATTDFAIGCYCEHRDRCHIAVLREALAAHDAIFL